MDIEQLRYFLAVCDCKQMTLAADTLFISQSSLSKHIGQLEKEIGVPLFDRTGRTLHITSAGMDFAKFARETVARQEAIIRQLQNYSQTETATLVLGTIPILAQYGLHQKLLQFQQQTPAIQLNILEEKSEHILKLLDDELVEMAIVRTNSLVGDNYKIMPLATDELLCICSSRHQLAPKACLNLTDLQAENFIYLDVGEAPYNIVLHACQKAGFSPRITQRFTRIETILGFVRENAGLSLLMAKDLTAFDCRGICQKKITPSIPSTVALVFPHGRKLSPAARALRDFLLSPLAKKKTI